MTNIVGDGFPVPWEAKRLPYIFYRNLFEKFKFVCEFIISTINPKSNYLPPQPSNTNGSAVSNIGLLPLASSFYFVIYAIGKPIKKELDNGN